MSRVSLGHTGRHIVASRTTRLAFVCVLAAGVMRSAAPCLPRAYLPLVSASGILWALAFVTFLIEFAPMLLAPRVDAGPG